MGGLVAVGLMGVAVAMTLFPVPIWVSRAFRRRRRQLALGPADLPVQRALPPHMSRPLEAVLTEARILSAAIEAPIDAAQDVRMGARFLGWQSIILASVPQGWASELLDSFENLRADTLLQIRGWLDTAYALPDPDLRQLEATGSGPTAIEGLCRTLESLELPRDVDRSRLLFGAVRDALDQLEAGLVGPALAPYR